MIDKPRALVLSIADCAHYLVGYTDQEEGQCEAIDLVKAEDGRPKKFPSLYQAKRWLVAQGANKAWLVMETPYDEMIGREPAGKSEMPLPLVEDRA